jgi:DNA repair exonuclease SbcCD ATPase subunit
VTTETTDLNQERNRFERWQVKVSSLRSVLAESEHEPHAEDKQRLKKISDDLQKANMKLKHAEGEDWVELKSGLEEIFGEVNREYDHLRAQVEAKGWARGLAKAESLDDTSKGWPEGMGEEGPGESSGWAEGLTEKKKVPESEGWSEGYDKR